MITSSKGEYKMLKLKKTNKHTASKITKNDLFWKTKIKGKPVKIEKGTVYIFTSLTTILGGFTPVLINEFIAQPTPALQAKIGIGAVTVGVVLFGLFIREIIRKQKWSASEEAAAELRILEEECKFFKTGWEEAEKKLAEIKELTLQLENLQENAFQEVTTQIVTAINTVDSVQSVMADVGDLAELFSGDSADRKPLSLEKFQKRARKELNMPKPKVKRKSRD